MMTFYDFEATKLNGQTVSMGEYKDKVIMWTPPANVDLLRNMKV